MFFSFFFLVLCRSNVSSPPFIKTEPSPTNFTSVTENGKKSKTLLNTRSILPKAVATPTQQQLDRKNPNPTKYTHAMDANSSTLKCQNDVKQNSSYSSAFQPKSVLANGKPTSALVNQQQQHQQKNLNGSYARLTSKLNCCRSCIRDTDDACTITNGKKTIANIVSMPKLKNDVKYNTTNTKPVDSNANYRFDADSKYKLPTDARFRRNSIDGNINTSIQSKNNNNSTFKRSIDEDDLQHGYFRRQSLDDAKIKEPPQQQKPSKKIPSPLHLNDNDYYRNGLTTNNNNNSHHQSLASLLDDNKKLIRQMSMDKYTDATTRLRKLEMKMRKHKIDVLKYVNEHEQNNPMNSNHLKQNGQKSLTYETDNNQYRTKLDNIIATKPDYAYPKLSIDNVLNTRKTIRKSASMGNGYGIISAADLYKLRATPERVT